MAILNIRYKKASPFHAFLFMQIFKFFSEGYSIQNLFTRIKKKVAISENLFLFWYISRYITM